MRNKAVYGANITENINEEVSDYETQRIRLLYSTFLLDSNPDDPVYNRYISLASRIFNVPTAFLSLVDSDRTWLKSSSGCEFIELPRMDSFCNYTIMSENSDVLVINDTLEDIRFSSIPIVRGSPYVRFFAGAPIIVNFMNIGTISIFDTTPNHNFNNDEILILQDISEALSYIITSRLQKTLQLNTELSIENNRLLASNEKESFNKLKSFLMHHIRTPLMSIGLSSNLLESNFQSITNELTLINPSGVQVLGDTIADLKTATKNLENIVSSTLCWNKDTTTTTSVNAAIDQSYHSENSLDKSFTICNIYEILRMIRSDCLQLTASYKNKISLQWFLMDDTILLEGIHSSFPEILTIILHTLHEQILLQWNNISVYIYYLPNSIPENSLLFPPHSFLSISENLRWHTSIFGQLHFQIIVSKLDEVSPQEKNNSTTLPILPSTSVSNSKIPLINASNIDCHDSIDNNNNMDYQEKDETNELSYDEIWTQFYRRIEFINNLLLEIKGTTPLTFLATTTTTMQSPRSASAHYHQGNLPGNVEETTIDNNDHRDKVFSFAIPCNIINRRKVDDMTTSSENSFDQLPSLLDKKLDCDNSIKSRSHSSHDSSNSITIAQDNESNTDESSTSSSSSCLGLHLTHNNSLVLLDDGIEAPDRYSSHYYHQSHLTYSLPPTASVVPSPAVSTHGLFTTPPDNVMKVLIIEDSKLIQRVLQRWLEAKHCLVTLADNGSAGLTLLTSRKFDITITDFVMPIMNGSDTLRLYKEWRKNYAKNGSEWNSNMLIIGMSANATEKHQNAGFNYGMHIYTPKPIDLEIMTTVLELRRKHREIVPLMNCIKNKTNLRTCLDVREVPVPLPVATTTTATAFTYLNTSNQSVESLSEISLSEWSTASAAASASNHFHRRRTKKVFRSVLPEPFPDENAPRSSSVDLPIDSHAILEEKSSENTPPFAPSPKVKVRIKVRSPVTYFISRVDRVHSNSITMLTQTLQRNTIRFPRIGYRPTSSSSSSFCCCFWSKSSSAKIESVVHVPG